MAFGNDTVGMTQYVPSSDATSAAAPIGADENNMKTVRRDADALEFPDAAASRLVPMPTHGFYPPTCSEFAASDGEYDRSHAVSTFVFEAHLFDPSTKREVNMSMQSAACAPEFTGRFRDSIVDPYHADERGNTTTTPLEDSKTMASARPNNDMYMPVSGRKCADPRVAGGTHTVVMRDYTCNMDVDPAIVEAAVVAAVHTYPKKFYEFMCSFVSATMGTAMHDWLIGVCDKLDAITSERINKLVNVHSWKMLCLLGRPFGTDGQHSDVDPPFMENLPVSDDNFSSRCASFDMWQCLFDHRWTYRTLAEKCQGLATPPNKAVIMLEVCNMWGMQWCEDSAIVDPKTHAPDYSKIEMHVPMNLNVGLENRMHNVPDWDETFHASKLPSCNPTLGSTLDTDTHACEHVAHVPAVAIPVAQWMGVMRTGLDEALEPAAAKTVVLTSGITPQTLAQAGGYRWGYGHSALTFVRLSNGKFSNYFTPYVVSPDGERTPNTTFPIRIAVCRDWGADVFNDPKAWHLDTAQPVVASVVAPPVDANQHLLPKSTVATIGPEASYQGVRQEVIRIRNTDAGWTMMSPGVFVAVPASHRSGTYERTRGPCSSRPLRVEHLPPYGPCTFVHNDTYFALVADDDGVVPFASHTDLERCITTSADREHLFVSAIMLYQTTASIAKGTTVLVDLVPKVPDPQVQARLLKTWGLSESPVAVEVTQDVDAAVDVDVAHGLGSVRDSALAARLSQLIVGRGIGMHLSHYLFTDLCAQPQNNTNDMPLVSAYLTSWYADRKSAFVKKFAALLRMYTQSRTKNGDDLPVLEEAVLLRAHLYNSGHSNAKLREYLHEHQPDMLPMLMPRCMPGAPHPKFSTIDSCVDLTSTVASLMAVDGGATSASVHTNCAAAFGMEWLSLYAHRAHSSLDTRRSSTWPSEYVKLRTKMPANSFVSVLLADDGTPTFRPHATRVYPRDPIRQKAFAAVAADPQNCYLYHVFRENSEGSTKMHMQAVTDRGETLVSAVQTLESLTMRSSDDSAVVRILPTYCFDMAPSRLSAEARAVVRTYAAWNMKRMLTTHAGVPNSTLDFLDDVLRDADVATVGGVMGVGHKSMSTDGKHAWIDGSVGDTSTALKSAWDVYSENASWITLSTIRHLGLHPTTASRFRMHDRYAFQGKYTTADVIGQADDELRERPRVDGYAIERMWDEHDDSHGRTFSDAATYERFLAKGVNAQTRLEDVALQCFTAHDYAMQLRNVTHQLYNRYGGSEQDSLYDARNFGGTFVDEVVNDHPFAHRLLAELDTAFGVPARSSAATRLARVAAHPFMRILNSLTRGALFAACDISTNGVTVRSSTEAVYMAATEQYRATTSGFYLPDPDGTMFATSTELTEADRTRVYELASSDVVHLTSDLAKDRQVPDMLDTVRLNNPNVTDGCLFFSMLDAAALLHHMRHHYNPADAIRCVPKSQAGLQTDSQHYSLRYMYDAFICSREMHAGASTWEVALRMRERAFPSCLLGGIPSRTWNEEYAPHCDDLELKETVCRVRRLACMWGTVGQDTVAEKCDRKTRHAVWVPLPLAETHTMHKIIGTFDHTHGMPINPWADPNGPLRTVFRSSKHNAYRMSRNDPASFGNWQSLLRYTAPTRSWRPSAMYGGDLVLADFVKHRMEKMSKTLAGTAKERTYESLRRARFGVTDDLQLFSSKEGDLDCLRDLTHIPDDAPDDAHRMPSHFLAYARNLAYLGLATGACEEGAKTETQCKDSAHLHSRFLNFWFRCYLNNSCTVHSTVPGKDDVPVLMGYYVHNGRPVYVASTLLCMHNKLNTLASAPSTRSLVPASNIAMFGQIASVVDSFVRRQIRRSEYKEAYDWVAKQDARFQGVEGELLYYKRLLALSNEHIEFLHRIAIAMLVKAGMAPNELPIGALELKTVDPKAVLQVDRALSDIRGATSALHDRSLTNGTAHLVADDHLTREAMRVRELVPPGDALVTTLLSMRYRTHAPDVPGHSNDHVVAVESMRKKKWEDFASAILDKALGVKSVSMSAKALQVSPTIKKTRPKLLRARSAGSGRPRASSPLERSMNRISLFDAPEFRKYRQRLAEKNSEKILKVAEKVARETRKSRDKPGGPKYTFKQVTDALAERASTGKPTYGLEDSEMRAHMADVFGDDYDRMPA